MSLTDLDPVMMEKELDRVKAKVFVGSNSAFLGPMMCTLTFIWDEECPTAATDGLNLWWNPHWFLSLPFKSRVTILKHELWHPARLHMLRRGNRDPKIWNYACDIRINNDLMAEGESFEDIEWGWIMPEIDFPERKCEEEIYDILMKQAQEPPTQPGSGTEGDMREPTEQERHEILGNAVRAAHQARVTGGAGAVPGDIQQIIEKFLESIVPWEVLLMRFFTEQLDEDYSWKRPARRGVANDIYLPSKFLDDGRLEHLCFYVDVSGSVSDADILRCNSEVKYIKDVLNPGKLTLVLFDTQVQHEYVFLEDEPFEKLVVTGRGGTSFHCVKEHIDKVRPSCAVILSDMDCGPMPPLASDTSVIWIDVNARPVTPPFGKIIFIRS